MMNATFTVQNEAITETVMAQYEAIRQLGPCNIFDFGCVQSYANDLEMFELATIEHSDYLYILKNYTDLMSHYEIDRSMSAMDILAAHGA